MEVKRFWPIVALIACASTAVLTGKVVHDYNRGQLGDKRAKEDELTRRYDANDLRKQARASLCESERMALDHILLDHSKAHGVPDEELPFYIHRKDKFQEIDCDKYDSSAMAVRERMHNLLDEVLGGSPGEISGFSGRQDTNKTSGYKESPDPELRREADALLSLEGMRRIATKGADEYEGNPINLVVEALRLAERQRIVVNAFRRRSQGK